MKKLKHLWNHNHIHGLHARIHTHGLHSHTHAIRGVHDVGVPRADVPG